MYDIGKSINLPSGKSEVTAMIFLKCQNTIMQSKKSFAPEDSKQAQSFAIFRYCRPAAEKTYLEGSELAGIARQVIDSFAKYRLSN